VSSSTSSGRADMRIAVVIPCYKVTRHVLGVIAAIGPEVEVIYAVDDACPAKSGDWIESNNTDPRVRVLRNEVNRGVGGAVMAGYRQALVDGVDVVVKIDGDGQMDPALLPEFVAPILAFEADYTKGNRFFDLEGVRQMPPVRKFGNAGLSFMSKISTGYWDVFDPTNGYTAIHQGALRRLNLDKISQRYFFETDMLFRLNLARAVVLDVPMVAKYADEESNLKVGDVLFDFTKKHAQNFFKRLFYNYYLRGASVASVELPLGVAFLGFGGLFGLYHWWLAHVSGALTPLGTIMLSALSVLVGLQFVLAFLSYDISQVPQRPIVKSWGRRK
jgi:dolichol-phosphate mannosyltransferase